MYLYEKITNTRRIILLRSLGIMFSFSQGKQCILNMAERIANLQSECGLVTSAEEFKGQYHFGLVEAVFEWARGMPFSEITNLTDVQEGRRKLQALLLPEAVLPNALRNSYSR